MAGVGEHGVTVLTAFLHFSCLFPDFSIFPLSAGQSVGPTGTLGHSQKRVGGSCITLLGLS